MDGVEVWRRLRADERTRSVPILMLTACDDTAERPRAVSARSDAYLSKPFERADLLARVRHLLQQEYGYGD
jgi:DNA-binding response OmpR family regulator